MKQTEKPTGARPTEGEWNYHNGNNEEYFDIDCNGNRICSIVAHDQDAEDNARAICEAVNATFGNRISPEAVPDLFIAVAGILNATRCPENMDDAIEFANLVFERAGGHETALFISSQNRNEK